MVACEGKLLHVKVCDSKYGDLVQGEGENWKVMVSGDSNGFVVASGR